MSKDKTILITREAELAPNLSKWCRENNIDLITRPFIKTEPLAQVDIPKTEWVFFSSPRGLNAYLKLHKIKADKIGVFGPGTLRELKEHNLQADFIGYSGDTPALVGEKFNATVRSNERVLFPISDRSKKSVLSELNPQKVVERITYTTNFIGYRMDTPPDIILFTSPSNIDGYLMENQINEKTLLIAMGKTTEKVLNKRFEKNQVIVLDKPEEKAIVDLIQSLTS